MTEQEAIEIMEEVKSLDDSLYAYDPAYMEALEIAISASKEVQRYRKIGTVEKCREAVEKQKAKAVKNRKLLKDFHGSPYCIQGDCPNCGCKSIKATATDYCYVCGQHLKWNENLEGMEDE